MNFSSISRTKRLLVPIIIRFFANFCGVYGARSTFQVVKENEFLIKE
jgi:hypothetical protein